MKKFLYILILIILAGAFIQRSPVKAAVPCTGPGTPPGCVPVTYNLLAPLPCDPAKDGDGCISDGTPKGGKLTSVDTAQNFGSYLNMMIRIFIGICAILSVVMIIMGGIEYMTSELVSSKESGKEKITGAIFGLVLALGAYAILFTINPDLLNSNIKVEPVNTSPNAAVINANTPGSCMYYQGGEYKISDGVTKAVCKTLIQNSPGAVEVGWDAKPTP